MPNDIVINATSRVPTANPVMNKPSYLIVLEEFSGKTKSFKYFISLDKPELLNGFVQVKGVFADSSLSENEIILNYYDILTTSKKELFLEMMIPWHKISIIRSLVFKAK
jgi:hypothetical protein